ncbi:MAG: phasin family protein [Beijerinckiaceae bacterium]
MAEDHKDTAPTGGSASGAPSYDFSKLLQQFKIPGVDISSIIERERKNIEALAEANKIAFEGWQNLVRRQGEILQESMKKAVEDVKAPDALKNAGEVARSAFQTALANMRELAEMAARSQKDAFDVIRKRVEENVSAFRGKTPDKQ